MYPHRDSTENLFSANPLPQRQDDYMIFTASWIERVSIHPKIFVRLQCLNKGQIMYYSFFKQLPTTVIFRCWHMRLDVWAMNRFGNWLLADNSSLCDSLLLSHCHCVYTPILRGWYWGKGRSKTSILWSNYFLVFFMFWIPDFKTKNYFFWRALFSNQFKAFVVILGRSLRDRKRFCDFM